MNKGIFLLLGSNLGNRLENLATAKALIEKQAGKIYQQSGVYRTAAWGKTDQPDFYNQVLEMESPLLPEELLREVLSIEKQMGRERKELWGARLIDIDILLYGSLQFTSADLTIPHPRMTERMFTLVPLHEIAPRLIHPVQQKSIEELLFLCSDTLEVTAVDSL